MSDVNLIKDNIREELRKGNPSKKKVLSNFLELLKKDKYGNWIIEEKYNADMLAAAMAKHEGFKYFPDPDIFWKQGQSTEKDFIFTTTQFVTAEFIDKIHRVMDAR